MPNTTALSTSRRLYIAPPPEVWLADEAADIEALCEAKVILTDGPLDSVRATLAACLGIPVRPLSLLIGDLGLGV